MNIGMDVYFVLDAATKNGKLNAPIEDCIFQKARKDKEDQIRMAGDTEKSRIALLY